jgi:hypothetical protein
MNSFLLQVRRVKIPETGHGGSFVSESSRLPNFLKKLLTIGGEVASLTPWLAVLKLQKDSWYSRQIKKIPLI